jgi:CheY-like chemotaxis protein
MARLLIVSRSMALAMRLADQHEITEHPADQLGLNQLLPKLDVDVLVLDVGDPVVAVSTVNTLREAEQAIPVLLVSGYQPEWEQVEAQDVDGVHVVALPITRTALLAGVSALTDEPGAVADPVPVSAPAPAPAAVSTPAPAPGSSSASTQTPKPTSGPKPVSSTPKPPPTAEPAPKAPPRSENPPIYDENQQPRTTPAVTGSDVAGLSYSSAITRPFDEEPRTGQFPIARATPTDPPRWIPEFPQAPGPAAGRDPQLGTTNGNAMARRMQRLGNRPRKLQRRSSPAENPAPRPTGSGIVTDPLGPRTDPYGFGSSDLDRRLDAEAVALVTRAGQGPGSGLGTAELVRLLHERAEELYSVSDTAQALADDVIERADADAAAILVPDGPVWRVSGGVGLRPLERRLELTDAHWLIIEIGSAGRAVLIEDTDIVRQQLAGAPLAAWRHLLAVPVPDVRGIVVLARGREGGPFTDRDLSAVIAPVREAAALLAQAVETRRLARALGPLREGPKLASP